ncbi:tRNA U-34 5-methylaminomethyl-2-thiouridine biosynthesis protein [Streptomyces sp. NPDC102360]|uniref:DODA-type extradiol aromatic ring-opening family dioxygenase n=1 Tax=Streptomyces sp. NPDC102360 TaxID=3366160 RepID=UPI00382DA9C1
MSVDIKSAYLIPSSPLPLLQPDAAGLRPIVEGLKKARRSLERATPDTLIVYSAGWMAVVDQMWLTRPHMTGRFVDHTWHEFGHIDWELDVDVPVAEAAIPTTQAFGVRSRGCDYDEFPIDAGTIVLSQTLNAEAAVPLVVTTNNLYHDWETTKRLGAAAVEAADRQGRSVSVVGIGGLSGSLHRHGVDFDEDHIASPEEDEANRRLLDLVTKADTAALEQYVPEYATVGRADMGMKHLAFVLGALGDQYSGAEVHGYGPLCGSGGAVVEFTP